MEPKMIKKQEVELDLITLATTKLPYSLKQGDTKVHEITLNVKAEENFEFERARVYYSNGDYQDIEGLTFIIKNSVLRAGIRSFEVEFVANEEIRRSGKVEYRVDSSINSTVEAYDKYNELKKLYDVYVDAADNEEKREQLKTELIELKNSIESDLESINLAVDDIVSSEDDRKQNEIVREQVRIELENLVADIQNKLDDGDFVGEKGEQGDKGEQGIQGIQGPKGEQGIKGDTGERGLQGVQGLKGDKGDKGEQGIQGVKGDTGEVSLAQLKVVSDNLATHKEDYVAEVGEINAQLAEKANKAQGAWITPTLLNGWEQLSNDTVGYLKDDMGFVHLKGAVTGGAIGTPILNLPNGYKSLNTNLRFAVVSNSNFGRMTITSIGVLSLTNGSPGWVSLDGITYRAEV